MTNKSKFRHDGNALQFRSSRVFALAEEFGIDWALWLIRAELSFAMARRFGRLS
jgi:hypothetical protein